MILKRKEIKKMSISVQDFNDWYPPGTPVILTDDSGIGYQTTTKSEAWELGDGTPVVKLEGVVGGYALFRVKAMECHRPNNDE